MGIIKTPVSELLDLSFGGCSLTGTREENQDALMVKKPKDTAELQHKGIVACIADGVSCSENGQKASHTATMQFILDYYATPNSWSIQHSATKVLTALNSWLFNQANQQALKHNGLVTTLSAIVFKSNTAHLFHIGDSRIYRIRNRQLQQLTRDHQRDNFGKSSYLTRALGMDNKLEVDYQTLALQTNDRFLLTTDGVHDTLSSQEINAIILQSQGNNEQVSRELCEAAIQKGSQDNTSCLLLDINHLPSQSFLEHQKIALSRTVPPVLKAGNQIDQFTVQKVLYSGARSHVYLVTHTEVGGEYVMKCPSPHYVDDTHYLTNFANEFWIGSQLDSPNIMKVYPTPRQTKFLYQLCEHIPGITLRQWMYDNPSPNLEEVRVILTNIIKSIRVMQRADMVHRDLKPENIMLTDNGEIKLIDFGATQVKGLLESYSIPEEDTPLGAVNYIAPEYLIHNRATSVSDLFSVSVIGYEMLTGSLPYKETTSQDLRSARHQVWHYEPATNKRESIPNWFDLVLKKACHPEPKHRYQVFSEFISDLYTPNASLHSELKEQPLIKRNPLLFWKGLSVALCIVAALELLVILTQGS